MRAEPKVPMKSPCKVGLIEGKRYAWCKCGRSSRQPWCDRSHAGSGLGPMVFRARRTADTKLCGCKKTKHPPYCDGSHRDIPDSDA